MKAIVLVSGGLDSTLAAELIKAQGIEVIAFNFKTPFCLCDKKSSHGCGSEAARVASHLGLELKTAYITDEFFSIVQNPRYGYGSNMNPCIDCRILLFRKAKELMAKINASFIVTGEVLGQRPMSQHKQALQIIDKESGLEGLVLRPLSAKLLAPTIPEDKGWVCRNKLLNFNGRSRRPQMQLAERFNIKDYPCSAGGCLLTDPQFAKRLKDLISHTELNVNNVELLKLGRHLRLGSHTKLIVGRNQQENERLLILAKENDYLFDTIDVPGPIALGRGVFDEGLINLACEIVCYYSDLNGVKTTEIIYRQAQGRERKIKVTAAAESQITKFRL